MQVPARQARFVPQLVPSGAAAPVSRQIDVPVVQLIVPVWQELLGVQARPHPSLSQAPLMQTTLVPHGVPFG
jgi:hypothetical protein